METHAHRCHDTADFALFNDEVFDPLLKQVEIWLRLERRTHGLAIESTISLRTRRAHGRTFARIQGAKMNTGIVCSAGHDAIQRIDLAGQMALANATDCRVAAHLADRLQILRQ